MNKKQFDFSYLYLEIPAFAADGHLKSIQIKYSGTPLYGHPLYTDSFACPDKKLIYFL